MQMAQKYSVHADHWDTGFSHLLYRAIANIDQHYLIMIKQHIRGLRPDW